MRGPKKRSRFLGTPTRPYEEAIRCLASGKPRWISLMLNPRYVGRYEQRGKGSGDRGYRIHRLGSGKSAVRGGICGACYRPADEPAPSSRGTRSGLLRGRSPRPELRPNGHGRHTICISPRSRLSAVGPQAVGNPEKQCAYHPQRHGSGVARGRRAHCLHQQRCDARAGSARRCGGRDSAAFRGAGDRRLQAQQDRSGATGRTAGRERGTSRRHRQSVHPRRAP